ncbi:hypothetical protein KCP76_20320 [Salmonella enterica subsp. enterica serovar Weltevreden]|nr:hypothetical protein KCP76_20320 [Salmonella enterica subsp. enterica serovar Weltevreden]
MTRSEYDPVGGWKAQTDAAGEGRVRLHMASGMVTAQTGPDGRTVRCGYNSQQAAVNVHDVPDGLRSTRSMMSDGRPTAGAHRVPVRRRGTAMITAE